MGRFDVLVDFAEAGDGGEQRITYTSFDLAAITADRADISDTAAGDDDLLVGHPLAGIHGQEAPNLDGEVGWLLAESHQHQMLADQNLGCGVEDQVIGFYFCRSL